MWAIRGSVPKKETAHLDERRCQTAAHFWQRTGHHFLRPNPAGQKTLIDLILDCETFYRAKPAPVKRTTSNIGRLFQGRPLIIWISNLLLLAVTSLSWSHPRSGRMTHFRSDEVKRQIQGRRTNSKPNEVSVLYFVDDFCGFSPKNRPESTKIDTIVTVLLFSSQPYRSKMTRG
jgi:hypothetical protein